MVVFTIILVNTSALILLVNFRCMVVGRETTVAAVVTCRRGRYIVA